MKKIILISLAIASTLFAACSSDDPLNLVNDKATYLKADATEEYSLDAASHDSWFVPVEIEAALDNCQLPEVETALYLGDYYHEWGIKKSAYMYLNVWISVKMSIKEYLMFESNGYATHVKEAYYVSATLNKEYTFCSFWDSENAKQQFANEYALIGTVQSEPINLNIGNCTCWKRSYNVNKWEKGESTYNADYGLQNSKYILSVFMNGEGSLQLTQHYPDIENKNLGTYYLTDIKPSNLPISQ